MKYLLMTRTERDELWRALETMPTFLLEQFESLPAPQTTRPGPEGAFSPVEQCWHLADLEREGFGVRIRRLLREEDPYLADFDGSRVAKEREYAKRSLADGIAAFRDARAANLATLRAVPAAEWSRRGTQEGVGRVALCDLPHMMAEHDAAHRAEIAAWSPGTR
jgi:hypothetical protein